MSYDINALIAKSEMKEILTLQFNGIRIIELPQNIIMIPLLNKNNEIMNGIINKNYSDIVLFIEAEYFGGAGGASCIGIQNGKEILNIAFNPSAINEGLKLLGVQKGNKFDEFDALDLGRDFPVDPGIRSKLGLRNHRLIILPMGQDPVKHFSIFSTDPLLNI